MTKNWLMNGYMLFNISVHSWEISWNHISFLCAEVFWMTRNGFLQHLSYNWKSSTWIEDRPSDGSSAQKLNLVTEILLQRSTEVDSSKAALQWKDECYFFSSEDFEFGERTEGVTHEQMNQKDLLKNTHLHTQIYNPIFPENQCFFFSSYFPLGTHHFCPAVTCELPESVTAW